MSTTQGLTWHEVVSSNINRLAYDVHVKTLYIEFKDGDLYSYHNVSKRTFDELLDAPSVGSYFHRNIRDQYDTSKL